MQRSREHICKGAGSIYAKEQEHICKGAGKDMQRREA